MKVYLKEEQFLLEGLRYRGNKFPSGTGWAEPSWTYLITSRWPSRWSDEWFFSEAEAIKGSKEIEKENKDEDEKALKLRKRKF